MSLFAAIVMTSFAISVAARPFSLAARSRARSTAACVSLLLILMTSTRSRGATAARPTARAIFHDTTIHAKIARERRTRIAPRVFLVDPDCTFAFRTTQLLGSMPPLTQAVSFWTSVSAVERAAMISTADTLPLETAFVISLDFAVMKRL